MIGRVVADDVEHRCPGAPGVVHVRERVRHARPAMQQRRRRLVGHTGIAVGRARHHALEQAEHAAHLGLAVERRDEMHLGGAGIGEADIHAVDEQRVAEAVGTVHSEYPTEENGRVVKETHRGGDVPDPVKRENVIAAPNPGDRPLDGFAYAFNLRWNEGCIRLRHTLRWAPALGQRVGHHNRGVSS